MFEHLRFVVVEDRVEDRRAVMYQLADAGFLRGNSMGEPETYVEARELLERVADRVEVLFLDLNIPRDNRDAHPEKGHGKRILDLIHDDLNRRAGVCIKVIVVSGEDLADGFQDEMLYRQYQDTLVSIVQKADLVETLQENLDRLERDPLRMEIEQLNLPVLPQYDTVVDPRKPIRERLEAARNLAIRLLLNEADHFANSFNSHEDLLDNLNGLMKAIEERFQPDRSQKRRVKVSAIVSAGGWGAFLWRGPMIQHLYTLNSYRNTYIHISEQPLRNPSPEGETWQVPPSTLAKLEAGTTVGKIIESIVRELLEWYLPWHHHVYAPWAESLPLREGGKP